jgi:tryptophanyl-tRNA synthetase
VVYPLASAFAAEITQSTVDAVYGDPENVGLSFYPAVQATHLLLPQLVAGRHPTLVPIAVDQDPHVRVCRDVAATRRYDLDKPAALLSKFLPSLAGPGKMSSSSETPRASPTSSTPTERDASNSARSKLNSNHTA